MVHYTTPEFTFIINDENVDLSSAEHIYVTFEQGTKTITKTGDDLNVENGNTIKVWFSQSESRQFETGPVMVQINWTFVDGNGKTQRAATGIKRVQITQNLLPKVVD